MENNIISSINVGFGNCVFLSRDQKSIESIISSKIYDSNSSVLSVRPKSVSVEHIDDLHDKLSLAYDGKNVEGTITWRNSQDGKHFVFHHFE